LVNKSKQDYRLPSFTNVYRYIGAFLLYIFLAGRWDWLSYYLRYVFPVLFVVAANASYRRVRSLPFFAYAGRARWTNNGGSLLSLLVFLYHNSNSAQQYALDIVELNLAGARAWGIHPAALERYVIFRQTIHSPCEGTVAAALDGLPDLIPPAADREHPAGNHIVISCEGVDVLLAHMRNGSVAVRAGDRVIAGQPLGAVGNTGNTSEPHLHIHAVRAGSKEALEGDGVPILFEGMFPVRNTTLNIGKYW
jgi:hypothetical protein